MPPAPRLDRSSWPVAPRPVRIVHVGLGNFSRAHLARYTAATDRAGEWGISAFTGRRPGLAAALERQQGLYTLIERGPVRDRLQVVESLSEAHPGGELATLTERLAAPRTAVLTLTVTEAGYRPPAVAERATAGADPGLPTVGKRLAAGLVERHRRGHGPLALVSLDNLHGNGDVLRELVLEALAGIDPVAARWAARELSFVGTSVDRITPPASEAERALVERELGLYDEAPVVCEPFSDWVLCGEFPAGRPAWEHAGARFVADIEPWERRKLWLLNGGHSLLAYLGLGRGHATVAQAAADRDVAAALERFWDLAAALLPGGERLELDAYRAALRERFANDRIGYPLLQVATDGLDKLRNRVVPVIVAARAVGFATHAAAVVVDAWARWLIDDPARAASDQNGERLRLALDASGDDARRGLLELLEVSN